MDSLCFVLPFSSPYLCKTLDSNTLLVFKTRLLFSNERPAASLTFDTKKIPNFTLKRPSLCTFELFCIRQLHIGDWKVFPGPGQLIH